MRKLVLLSAAVLCLTLVNANAYALDLYAFGFSNFNSGNNLNINGTPFYNTDSGWFDQTGQHVAGNQNYIDGRADSSAYGPLFHNYFSFDLSNLSTGVTSATFNVYGYTITQSETYYLYGTGLIPSQVNSSVNYVGRTDIYDALVSGVLLGSVALTSADANTYIAIALNSSGIAWLDGHAGQGIVLGGGNEYSAPPSVPEPAAMLLLGLGLVGLAGVRKRLR